MTDELLKSVREVKACGAHFCLAEPSALYWVNKCDVCLLLVQNFYGERAANIPGRVAPKVIEAAFIAAAIRREFGSTCKTCDGTGKVHSHNDSCPDCTGGKV